MSYENREDIQAYFEEAADCIYRVIIGELDSVGGIDDALALLDGMPDNEYYPAVLIGGLKLQLRAAYGLASRQDEQSKYLVAVLSAMSSHDRDDGQIVEQLYDCLESM